MNEYLFNLLHMPQIFQVLRCYKCLIFQVHQTKKANKWECKLCGEKQSIKRHYGVGTAKDCRLHVQKLNIIKGEANETYAHISIGSTDDKSDEEINSSPEVKLKIPRKSNCKSKWKDYIEEVSEVVENMNENNHLGGENVVLELPQKKFKSNKWKPPVGLKIIENFTESSKEYLNGNNIKAKIINEKSCQDETDETDNKMISIINNVVNVSQPTVLHKKHSKWANYVDTDEVAAPPKTFAASQSQSTFPDTKANIFALSDEVNLDDYLDF